MARASYAYGVDVRRARWFANSSLSQTAMRAIELRWYRLVDSLTPDELAYPDDPNAMPLLGEVSALAQLLHMRAPGVRLLTERARASGDWGLVTPMGNVRGSEDWLVLDAEGLRAQPPGERAFLLGAAMGHLQCGHGPIFVSHFVGHRAGGGRLVRRLLAPWTFLSAFSADRAGLLAAGGLEAALMGLGTQVAQRVPWYPKFAPLHQRRQSLEDFERSRVVARVRTRVALARARLNLQQRGPAPAKPESAPAPEGVGEVPERDADTTVPPGVPATAWPLARCDQRLTRRIGLF